MTTPLSDPTKEVGGLNRDLVASRPWARWAPSSGFHGHGEFIERPDQTRPALERALAPVFS